MKIEVIRKIVDINNQFYQTFGKEFSATRGRIQSGVRKILNGIGRDSSILDLGCGNGEFARQLAEAGHTAPYHGVDFSLPLLTAARLVPEDFPAQFSALDITEKEWGIINEKHSIITAFAVLHHIPGEETRLEILKNIHQYLADDGQFIFSNWQFLNSERLRKRILNWDLVNISEKEIDEGDYLLDWRRGGFGIRYAHHYSEDELTYLAKMSGFRIIDSFYSDGSTGNLGLYQIWEKN
ncbi:MAG: class I SAM-dependent methyltransferase [Anaerolineae bacterium]|mgnify:CR=1 FL=1|jgi:tRNA (uracil-5-)-methyltransferase TRM9|nr:class I SAM-dependent methyltransferase [Anaerolineae bacterium]MBT7073430.1 class I SAM-dependent methyltransferase [Anaerolineae bacterium]MBT7781803.1 class I SAM-dependent methyltransferase [Anaerolineae bacterium]